MKSARLKSVPTPKSSAPTPPIVTRPLTSGDWPVVERLFGPNGACGGCWCMYWRLPRGGKLWEESKGAPNKRSFKKLLTADHVHGCLAFADHEPIGWCGIGPRADFPRLERTKALRVPWDETTWAVVCFYIRPGWRRHGVAGALLKEAVEVARRGGARTLHGYPVRPSAFGPGQIPAAFAWTGVAVLFRKTGFRDITPPDNTRDILAKRLPGGRSIPSRRI